MMLTTRFRVTVLYGEGGPGEEDADEDSNVSMDGERSICMPYDDMLGPDGIFVDHTFNGGKATRRLRPLLDYIELGQGEVAKAAASLIGCQKLQDLVTALRCRGLIHGDSVADARDLLRMMRVSTTKSSLDMEMQPLEPQFPLLSNEAHCDSALPVREHELQFGEARFSGSRSSANSRATSGSSAAHEEDLSPSVADQAKAAHEKAEHSGSISQGSRIAAMRKVEALHHMVRRHASLPADALLDKIELDIDLQEVFNAFVGEWGSVNDRDDDDYQDYYWDDPLVDIGGLDPDIAAAYWDGTD